MYTYKLLSDEAIAFVTIHRNAYPGVPFESDVPLSHPLLELVEDAPAEVKLKSVKEPAVPDNEPSPVAVDEQEEN